MVAYCTRTLSKRQFIANMAAHFNSREHPNRLENVLNIPGPKLTMHAPAPGPHVTIFIQRHGVILPRGYGRDDGVSEGDEVNIDLEDPQLNARGLDLMP